MKTLPLTLRKNSFCYTQALRGQRSCIYEQRVSETSSYFEVFLIKIKPERKVIIKGVEKTFEAKEAFPHDEAFGKWAWSFCHWDSAIWRYEELESGLSRKDFTVPNTKIKKYENE